MITPTELAWIAGIVEGEGTIVLSSKNKTSPGLIVAMCDLDVIVRLSKFFGTNVTTKKKQKAHWSQIYVTRAPGPGWLMTLYPWLGARRRARIREVLKVWRSTRGAPGLRTHCPGGHAYAQHGISRRTGRGMMGRFCLVCQREKERNRTRSGRRHVNEPRQGQLS